MTTATTQSPQFTFVRTVDTYGVTYRAYDTAAPQAFAFVALVYRAGRDVRGGRVWRATLTRGSYATRYAAACAALAQRDDTRVALDAHEEQWAADADAAIADPQ